MFESVRTTGWQEDYAKYDRTIYRVPRLCSKFYQSSISFLQSNFAFFHLRNYAFPNLIQASLSLLFSKRNLFNKYHHNTRKICLNNLCTLPNKNGQGKALWYKIIKGENVFLFLKNNIQCKKLSETETSTIGFVKRNEIR